MRKARKRNFPILVAPESKDLTNAGLREVYDYWAELRGGRNMPHPDSVDLLKLAPHLRKIYIFDTVDGGADHSVVFNGNFFGGETAALRKGDRVRSIEQTPFRERTLAILKMVIDSKKPVHLGPIKSVYVGHEFRVIEVLCLPLSSNDRDVTRTLSVFDYAEQ